MKNWTGENMKKLFLFLIVFMLLIEGCGTKTIIRKYYLLEFGNQLPAKSKRGVFVNQGCEIFPAKVPPAYAQSRIAVRIKSHEISYYQNHQWAVTPGDIITKLVESHLKEEHIFTNVSQTVWEVIPQYQIHSEIFQIEAVDRDDNLYAHLSMKLDLFDRSENRIIVSHSFKKMEMLEERDLNLLASNLSSILKEELQNFTYKIKKFLTGRL